VSVNLESHLSRGEVVATVALPDRQLPTRTLMRARVPDGWRVQRANADGKTLSLDEQGTVDLTGLRGKVAVKFEVARVGAR
jgi:hypothetical protein